MAERLQIKRTAEELAMALFATQERLRRVEYKNPNWWKLFHEVSQSSILTQDHTNALHAALEKAKMDGRVEMIRYLTSSGDLNSVSADVNEARELLDTIFSVDEIEK